MADIAYVPDRAGMSGLGLNPQMSAAMVAVAEQAMAFAVAEAPRGRTGRYASSFQVLPITVQAGRPPGPRAGAMLVNTVGYAAAVEWRVKPVLAMAARTIDGRRHGAERTAHEAQREARAQARRASSGRRRRPSQR